MTDPAARAAAAAVFRAQMRSHLSGAYWENEMLTQGKEVAQLPLSARVEFYRALVLNCDLDTSRATLFAEMVGRDVDDARNDLVTFERSAKFQQLEAAQKQAVEDWITEFDVISKQVRY